MDRKIEIFTFKLVYTEHCVMFRHSRIMEFIRRFDNLVPHTFDWNFRCCQTRLGKQNFPNRRTSRPDYPNIMKFSA